MTGQHQALRWLHLFTRMYPDAWRGFAELINDPPEPWPAWCWCPMAGGIAVQTGGRLSAFLSDSVADAENLSALGAWRATQTIVRFDPTLYEELLRTPMAGELPATVLERLPVWCPYVETPGLMFGDDGDGDDDKTPVIGFFVWLEFDVNTHRQELRFAFELAQRTPPEPLRDTYRLSDRVLMHIPLELVPGATIESALHDLYGRYLESVGRHGSDNMLGFEIITTLCARALSLTLYLCADERDVSAPIPPLPPRVVPGKKRPLLPAPKHPTVYEMGARLGAALRHARERAERPDASGAGAKKAPHMRAAHWHHYRVGPRSAPPRHILRWLPPIAVNLDDVPPEPTIRPVSW